MLRKILATAAVLGVAIALALSVQARGRRPDAERRRVVDAQMLADINGTYVETVWSAGCDMAAVTSGAWQDTPRAISVVYSRGIMTLRAVPPVSLRLLHVQTRPQLIDTRPVRFHNGVGRWEDGDLIVESLTPTLPLWSTPIARPNGTLREQFSFSPMSLTYRASYRSASEDDATPFELTLRKCEASYAN